MPASDAAPSRRAPPLAASTRSRAFAGVVAIAQRSRHRVSTTCRRARTPESPSSMVRLAPRRCKPPARELLRFVVARIERERRRRSSRRRRLRREQHVGARVADDRVVVERVRTRKRGYAREDPQDLVEPIPPSRAPGRVARRVRRPAAATSAHAPDACRRRRHELGRTRLSAGRGRHARTRRARRGRRGARLRPPWPSCERSHAASGAAARSGSGIMSCGGGFKAAAPPPRRERTASTLADGATPVLQQHAPFEVPRRATDRLHPARVRESGAARARRERRARAAIFARFSPRASASPAPPSRRREAICAAGGPGTVPADDATRVSRAGGVRRSAAQRLTTSATRLERRLAGSESPRRRRRLRIEYRGTRACAARVPARRRRHLRRIGRATPPRTQKRCRRDPSPIGAAHARETRASSGAFDEHVLGDAEHVATRPGRRAATRTTRASNRGSSVIVAASTVVETNVRPTPSNATHSGRVAASIPSGRRRRMVTVAQTRAAARRPRAAEVPLEELARRRVGRARATITTSPPSTSSRRAARRPDDLAVPAAAAVVRLGSERVEPAVEHVIDASTRANGRDVLRRGSAARPRDGPPRTRARRKARARARVQSLHTQRSRVPARDAPRYRDC